MRLGNVVLDIGSRLLTVDVVCAILSGPPRMMFGDMRVRETVLARPVPREAARLREAHRRECVIPRDPPPSQTD